MDKRIGAQLYTVRDFMKTEEDFASTMKRIADIGYKSVQLSGLANGVVSAEKIYEICTANGLKIASTHRGYDEYESGIEGVIAFHKALGCDSAGLGALPGKFRTGKLEDADAAIDVMNRAWDRLAEEGIEFAYHNHAFEFAKLENGQTLFDRLLEKGKFNFILDVYWLSFAGIDPAKKLAEIGERASVLHYKDMKVKFDNSVTYTDVGNGTLDWDGIVKASSKARWAMVEEDTCDGDDPIEALAKSYRFLTSNYDFI